MEIRGGGDWSQALSFPNDVPVVFDGSVQIPIEAPRDVAARPNARASR